MSDLNELRLIFYIAMVIGFCGAGAVEFFTGNYRLGSIAALLAMVQVLVFLVGREQ